MRVIGFNFTKISAEKLKDSQSKISIKTGVDIKDIKEIKDSVIKLKEDILEVEFAYNVDYVPDFAKVNLKGKMIVSLDDKASKEVLKQWKKQDLPEDFRLFIINVAIKKSSLKALSLEEEIGLPLHIPLPSVRKDQ